MGRGETVRENVSDYGPRQDSDRVLVRCVECGWEGRRTKRNASRPCPHCDRFTTETLEDSFSRVLVSQVCGCHGLKVCPYG